MDKTDTTCNDSEERHVELAPPQSTVSEKHITRVSQCRLNAIHFSFFARNVGCLLCLYDLTNNSTISRKILHSNFMKIRSMNVQLWHACKTAFSATINKPVQRSLTVDSEFEARQGQLKPDSLLGFFIAENWYRCRTCKVKLLHKKLRTIGFTCLWQSCRLNPPAAIYTQGIFLVLISVTRWVQSRSTECRQKE